MNLSDLHDIETRQTDHATGGQKGAKDTMIGALDPVALLILGRVAGMGAKKYAAFNFLQGYDWSLSYNALLRHVFLWMAGEDDDVESGLPHMAHVMWHAHTLVGFEARGLGTDDRAPALGEQDEQMLVLGHPMEDVLRWKAAWDMSHPQLQPALPTFEEWYKSGNSCPPGCNVISHVMGKGCEHHQ